MFLGLCVMSDSACSLSENCCRCLVEQVYFEICYKCCINCLAKMHIGDAECTKIFEKAASVLTLVGN